MNKRVVVGMSGGVDSSVAALLLKEQGFDVIGMTMEVLDRSDAPGSFSCEDSPFDKAAEDAKAVADLLGIPLHVVDYREVFQERVKKPFIDAYLTGKTPNPCVACNRYVKWDSMLKTAKENDADYVATGHYARIEKLVNGRFAVKNSASALKDQTYMLSGLSQEQLSRTLMPIGDYDKEEVRKIAGEAHLPVAEKKDSQDICFIPDGDYAGYISRKAPDKLPGPGKFLWTDGAVLGENKGIIHYTIGQRKHLGIAMGHPIFVTDIDAATGNVIIGEEKDVFGAALICRNLNFMSISPEDLPIGASMEVRARIRYSHGTVAARITRKGSDELVCEFPEKVRAITSGQTAVFYDGEYVLAAGVIEKKI